MLSCMMPLATYTLADLTTNLLANYPTDWLSSRLYQPVSSRQLN